MNFQNFGSHMICAMLILVEAYKVKSVMGGGLQLQGWVAIIKFNQNLMLASFHLLMSRMC